MPLGLNVVNQYSISLLWCNLCRKEKNETIWGNIGEEDIGRYLSPALKWALANPEANIIYWYDSEFTTETAIQNTNRLIRNYQQRHNINKDIVLADIRSLDIVKQNPELFSELVPGYLRVDLLKLIILVHEIEISGMDAAVFADLEVGDNRYGFPRGIRMSRTELFSDENMKLHNRYALLNGLTEMFVTENQYFQLTRNKHMVEALKYALINPILEECANTINALRRGKNEEIFPGYVWLKMKEGLHWKYYQACQTFDPSITSRLRKNRGLGVAVVEGNSRPSKRQFDDGVSDRRQRCLALKADIIARPLLQVGHSREEYLAKIQEINRVSIDNIGAKDFDEAQENVENVDNRENQNSVINSLHEALMEKDETRALTLLADKDSLFRERESVALANCLILACEQKMMAVVEGLLKIGININAQNSLGQTLLHMCCLTNNQSLLQMLLTMPNLNVDARDNMNCNCLHYLCNGTKDASSIDLLLKLQQLGANIRVIDADGNTLLHLAFKKGDYSLCEYLLRNGFNPNQRNYMGNMPVYSQYEGINTKLAILFITYGAKIPTKPSQCERVLTQISLDPNLSLKLCIEDFESFCKHKFLGNEPFIFSTDYVSWWKKLDAQRVSIATKYLPAPDPNQELAYCLEKFIEEHRKVSTPEFFSTTDVNQYVITAAEKLKTAVLSKGQSFVDPSELEFLHEHNSIRTFLATWQEKTQLSLQKFVHSNANNTIIKGR